MNWPSTPGERASERSDKETAGCRIQFLNPAAGGDFIEDGGQARVECEGGLQGESSASCLGFPSE